MYLAQAGLSVLVIEALASPGQASNKHAIGGIRATHSDHSKIYLCASSIEVFSTWKEVHGDDIDWRAGGYSFVAYDDAIENTLKSLLNTQHEMGLNIDWHDSKEILEFIPSLILSVCAVEHFLLKTAARLHSNPPSRFGKKHRRQVPNSISMKKWSISLWRIIKLPKSKLIRTYMAVEFHQCGRRMGKTNFKHGRNRHPYRT